MINLPLENPNEQLFFRFVSILSSCFIVSSLFPGFYSQKKYHFPYLCIQNPFPYTPVNQFSSYYAKKTFQMLQNNFEQNTYFTKTSLSAVTISWSVLCCMPQPKCMKLNKNQIPKVGIVIVLLQRHNMLVHFSVPFSIQSSSVTAAPRSFVASTKNLQKNIYIQGVN